MKNAITIDVEDWYQTQDFNFETGRWDQFEDRVEYSTRTLLDILDRFHIRATFFVLGYIARKHPALIREISEKGHEIGSHGGWHRMVNCQIPGEFREDAVGSKKLLEDIIGRPVDMFRASSWSISSKTLWALQILDEEGFICDSSIQPFQTPLSGMKGAPLEPFHPTIDGKRLDIIEYPQTVLELCKMRIPFAGGFYMRALPFWFIKLALRRVNMKRSGMVYIHPWETDHGQPRLSVRAHIKMVHYLNLTGTAAKLEKMLRSFEFVPLSELIREEKYAGSELCLR